RDAHSLLLFLWVMGTWLFLAYGNWVVNARTILPAVPAAAILLMRRIDQRFGSVNDHTSLQTLRAVGNATAATDRAVLQSVRTDGKLAPPPPPGSFRLWGPLVPAACLALATAVADYSMARSAQQTAEAIRDQSVATGRGVYFSGH